MLFSNQGALSCLLAAQKLFSFGDISCSAFQGWYIVTYALGIYHLNLFIAFLSPKVDPSMLDEGKSIKNQLFVTWLLCSWL